MTNEHPLYHTISKKKFQDYSELEKTFVKNCYGGGKYCVSGITSNSKVSKDKSAYGINMDTLNMPFEILDVNLIQSCLYELTKGNNEDLAKIYFSYLREFYSKCILNNSFSKICAKSILNNLKTDRIANAVNTCVYYSFEFTSKIVIWKN